MAKPEYVIYRNKKSEHIFRSEKQYDYLKYHRIIMAWARKRYKIQTAELEMLFYLYSEDVFTMTEFRKYSITMPFDRYKLERMIDDGWIKVFRTDEHHRNPLFELTDKAKKAVVSIYRKFNGVEPLSDSERFNELIRDASSKMKKHYKIISRKMNKNTIDARLAEKTVLVNPDE